MRGRCSATPLPILPILAKDGAGPEEDWITEMYSTALAEANESERALAHKYLEDWLKKRRE